MTFFVTTGIGLVLCILGIVNMTGNISSLHSYHRKRVTEENRKPFGRLVGVGTLIIGIAVIAYSTFLLIYEKTSVTAWITAGSAVLITGIVVGLGLSFYAMIKYNKGIF